MSSSKFHPEVGFPDHGVFSSRLGTLSLPRRRKTPFNGWNDNSDTCLQVKPTRDNIDDCNMNLHRGNYVSPQGLAQRLMLKHLA